MLCCPPGGEGFPLSVLATSDGECGYAALVGLAEVQYSKYADIPQSDIPQ